jgi:hypothetical protein
MNPSKEDIKQWLAAYPERDREWLAIKCGTAKRTVDNWLSTKKEMPPKAVRIIASLMREDAEKTKVQHEQMTHLSIPATMAEFNAWSKAALAKQQILTEWAAEAVRNAYQDHLAESGLKVAKDPAEYAAKRRPV